jgi:MFS family permease
VGAGLVLGALEPGAAGRVEHGAGGAGYTTLFAIAAGFRLVSAVLLALSPELRFAGMPAPGQVFRFLRTARGSIAWRVLVGGAVLQLTVYVSSPYFGPFMLEDLQFSYVEYTIASACVVLLKFVALPLWGRSVDAFGARPVYALAAVAVAVVPLPWLWANGLVGVALAQGLSGFAWAGYEISFFGLLLSSSYRRTRPVLFAAQSLCSGSAQVTGMLVGAALLGLFGRDLRLLFGVSLFARLAVALTAPRWAPAQARGAGPGRRAILVQVLGFRAHGGLVHRAVEAPERSPPRPAR